MNTRSSTWSVVLAFGDSRSLQAPDGTNPDDWYVAACLDTLEVVVATIDPSHVIVVTACESVATAAQQAGATVRAPGRDLNADVSAALGEWARTQPQRSALALVGPLPYATPQSVLAALRACAATEAAVIPADDGGTIALSHHDPARLTPRFGGRSSIRHERGGVVVGQHIDGLQRVIAPGRAYPGPHLREVIPPAGPADTASLPSTTEEGRA